MRSKGQHGFQGQLESLVFHPRKAQTVNSKGGLLGFYETLPSDSTAFCQKTNGNWKLFQNPVVSALLLERQREHTGVFYAFPSKDRGDTKKIQKNTKKHTSFSDRKGKLDVFYSDLFRIYRERTRHAGEKTVHRRLTPIAVFQSPPLNLLYTPIDCSPFISSPTGLTSSTSAHRRQACSRVGSTHTHTHTHTHTNAGTLKN